MLPSRSLCSWRGPLARLLEPAGALLITPVCSRSPTLEPKQRVVRDRKQADRTLSLSTSIMADPSAIASQFVQFYYAKFDSNRAELAPLYRQQSMLTFEANQFGGTEAIIKKLGELPFQKVEHEVATLDAQPSNPGQASLLVLVTGKLKVDGGENTLGFSQSFQLIQEGGTYYVLNDIFRLVYG